MKQKKNILLFTASGIIFAVLFFLIFSMAFAKADDLQLSTMCGGDLQLGISCIGGDLQLSSLGGAYDTIAPSVVITSPLAGNSYDTVSNFPFNYTISDAYASLGTCIYNVLYKNSFYAQANTTLSCGTNSTFNPTLDGWYILNFWANNTPWGIMNYTSINFTINTASPATNLNSPANGSWSNTNKSNNFTFTTADTHGIKNCQLWSNFTGTWAENDTNSTPVTDNVPYTFTESYIPQGAYIWDVLCTNGLGTMNNATHNYSFYVDTTPPQVSFLSVNASTVDSLTYTIKYNITDNMNISQCTFSLYDSSGNLYIYSANSSLDCSQTTKDLITTSGGQYHVVIYGEDSAGNLNSSTLYFTTTSPSNGGGGGGFNAISNNITGWKITTDNGGFLYQYDILDGTSRSGVILLQNTGTTEQNIGLTCVDVNGTLCKHVSFDDLNIKLPVQNNISVQTGFTVNVPPDYGKGTWVFNIKGVDDYGRSLYITVQANTNVGFVTAATEKVILQPLYLLIYFLIAIGLGYFSDRFVFRKIKVSRSWSMMFSTLLGLGGSLMLIGLTL